jgi:hypothetical protein
MWRRDVRPPSDFRKQKSPRPFSGAGFERILDDATMQLICPTCQTLTRNSPNQIRKTETNSANRALRMKKPAPFLSARAYNSFR